MRQDTIQGSTAALYDATFREYAMYGRWTSPDPAGVAAVKVRNPQTWNRYAYVVNNPLKYTDSAGLVTPNCGDAPCLFADGYEEMPFDGGSGFAVPVDANDPCYAGVCTNLGQRSPLPQVDPPLGVGVAANNCTPGSPGCFNVPTRKEACLAEYNNSTAGKGMQFLSLYNLASSLGSLKTWAEWTALPAAKVLTLNAVSKLSQAIGNTEFLSVTGGTSTVVTAPTAAGITATEAAGSVGAPLAILAATAGDMNMQSYCSGYITVAPPHGH